MQWERGALPRPEAPGAAALRRRGLRRHVQRRSASPPLQARREPGGRGAAVQPPARLSVSAARLRRSEPSPAEHGRRERLPPPRSPPPSPPNARVFPSSRVFPGVSTGRMHGLANTRPNVPSSSEQKRGDRRLRWGGGAFQSGGGLNAGGGITPLGGVWLLRFSAIPRLQPNREGRVTGGGFSRRGGWVPTSASSTSVWGVGGGGRSHLGA